MLFGRADCNEIFSGGREFSYSWICKSIKEKNTTRSVINIVNDLERDTRTLSFECWSDKKLFDSINEQTMRYKTKRKVNFITSGLRIRDAIS